MPILTKREQRWLYLDKIDFKSITVIRGKDEHDKMIKGQSTRNLEQFINMQPTSGYLIIKYLQN